MKRAGFEPRPMWSTPVALISEQVSPAVIVEAAPSQSFSSLPATTTTSSARSQERYLDLQRSSLEGLLGHDPEIFLIFLLPPPLARETMAGLSFPFRESANLFTRSWNEREQNFLTRNLLICLWLIRYIFRTCIIEDLGLFQCLTLVYVFLVQVKAELDKMLKLITNH